MAYIRGKDCRVLLTTENGTNGVDLGSAPVIGTATLPEGIAGGRYIKNRGGVTTAADTVNALANVEGISFNPGAESETKVFHGSTKDHIIPLRQTFDISITMTGKDRAWAKMFQAARFGVTGTTTPALIDGLSEYGDDVGYRVYLVMGGKTMVFYHALLADDGFKEELDPQKVNVQTIKFVGNLWAPDVADANLDDAAALE